MSNNAARDMVNNATRTLYRGLLCKTYAERENFLSTIISNTEVTYPSNVSWQMVMFLLAKGVTISRCVSATELGMSNSTKFTNNNNNNNNNNNSRRRRYTSGHGARENTFAGGSDSEDDCDDRMGERYPFDENIVNVLEWHKQYIPLTLDKRQYLNVTLDGDKHHMDSPLFKFYVKKLFAIETDTLSKLEKEEFLILYWSQLTKDKVLNANANSVREDTASDTEISMTLDWSVFNCQLAFGRETTMIGLRFPLGNQLDVMPYLHFGASESMRIGVHVSDAADRQAGGGRVVYAIPFVMTARLVFRVKARNGLERWVSHTVGPRLIVTMKPTRWLYEKQDKTNKEKSRAKLDLSSIEVEMQQLLRYMHHIKQQHIPMNIKITLSPVVYSR